MNLEKIPATIVTGFLGSGKTTLLSNIVREANGKRIAVIVNEFGELDIDAELLRSCPLDCEDGETASTNNSISEDGIYELANGCICCTVEEEFLPVMQQLVDRRDDIDHILIETSGLALPKPLVQAFNWPQIKQHCTVDAVITVVDGPAIVDGRIADNPDQVAAQRAADDNLDHDPSLQELLEDQLGSADMVIISKSDQVAEGDMQSIKDKVSGHVSPHVKMLEVNEGKVAAEVIMGLNFATEERIESVHSHHDHHHAHDEEHAHAHDDYMSISVTLNEVDGDACEQVVRELIAAHGILRVKGFLALPGKPMRQVLQGVGSRIERYFDRLWSDGESKQGRLVFIGKDLPEADIQAALQSVTIAA